MTERLGVELVRVGSVGPSDAPRLLRPGRCRDRAAARRRERAIRRLERSLGI